MGKSKYLNIVSQRSYSHQWTIWSRLMIDTKTSPVILCFQGCNVGENIVIPTSYSFLFPQYDFLQLVDFKTQYQLSLLTDHQNIADVWQRDLANFPVWTHPRAVAKEVNWVLGENTELFSPSGEKSSRHHPEFTTSRLCCSVEIFTNLQPQVTVRLQLSWWWHWRGVEIDKVKLIVAVLRCVLSLIPRSSWEGFVPFVFYWDDPVQCCLSLLHVLRGFSPNCHQALNSSVI